MRELPSGLVTFCFVDVEGSTRTFQSDPTGYPGALSTHHALVSDAFAETGGVIVETEGDGLFAVFADAAAAVAGCLGAQRAIAAYGWPPGLRLRSRMGLHADEAIPVGSGYVALGVHQAARVSAAAHGGQVICSESVAREARERLPPGAVFVDLGRYRLKDFDLPARIFEVRHPELAGEFPPLRAPKVVLGNLRLLRTSFIGRGAELSELRALVGVNRLVTVLGPGGVGKTRLAFRLAGELTESFAKGAWTVELAATADPSLVADAVAACALPLPAFVGGAPLDKVVAYLAGQRLLLVLDNCEHVIEGVAEFVDQLLDVAADVAILATSRVPLEVAGEFRYVLRPLGVPSGGARLGDLLDSDAVRLFMERAKAAHARFTLDEANGPLVSAICRRLDGLPLALELAGARTGTLAPADLLARLDSRLALLATNARGVPERQRTLRATVAWSYDLLSEPERILLNRLATFASRFRLEWIEEVCAAAPLALDAVVDLVDSLVAKSLVAAEDREGSTEYELLVTVRVFAAEQLADRGEDGEMERARTDFLVRRLAPTDPIFQFSAETGHYLEAAAGAADDVRASLSWCLDNDEADRACALIAVVFRWWNVTGRIEELGPLARRAVELEAPPSLARLMTYYALLLALEASDADTFPEREGRIVDMMALARELDDDDGLALALYCNADIPWANGDLESAARMYDEAAEAARRAGHEILAATILRSQAETRAVGDSAALARSVDRLIDVFRRARDPFGLTSTLAVLAQAELLSGQYRGAVAHAAEGLRLAREHGYVEHGWRHLVLLAWAATTGGQAEVGARLLGAVDAWMDRVGGKVGAGAGDQADRDRVRSLLLAVLEPGQLDDRHADGRGLTEAEATELALAVV